jgi:hypothetical protein
MEENYLIELDVWIARNRLSKREFAKRVGISVTHLTRIRHCDPIGKRTYEKLVKVTRGEVKFPKPRGSRRTASQIKERGYE